MGEELERVTLHGDLRKKRKKIFAVFAKMTQFGKKMQNFRLLGSQPPDPRASRGFATRPSLASGGWGLRPRSPN